MAQGTFNDGDALSVVRTTINANANDAESRLSAAEGHDFLDKTDLAAQTVAGPVEFLQDLTVPPASLILGAGGAELSSGTRFFQFRDALGGLQYFPFFDIKAAGNTSPVYYQPSDEADFIVNPDFGTTLSDPQEMAFPTTAGDTYTVAFTVRPMTVGDLLIETWAGTDDTGAVLISNTFPVLIGDVGTELRLDLPNPITLFTGDDIFTRFSGVQLDGAVQSSGPFIGLEKPFISSSLNFLTPKELILSGEAVSKLDGVKSQIVVKSLDDLAQYLVGDTYELTTPTTYVFEEVIDFGTNKIRLMVADADYLFTSSALATLVYSGTDPFIANDVLATGITFKLGTIRLSTPNATCIFFRDGVALLPIETLFAGCARSIDIADTEFLTLNTCPHFFWIEGILAHNVESIQMTEVTWGRSVAGGGTGLTLTGASSQRLVASGITTVLDAGETFIEIDPGYGGQVSLTGGFKSLAGTFFGGSRDQTDPNISVAHITNVASSLVEAFGHVDANALVTTIAVIDTPVKVNAVWVDVDKSRFTFSSDGRWTYTGLEDLKITAAVVGTVNPSGGSDRDISVYLAKNGAVLTNSRGLASASTGSQISSTGVIDLVTGDYVEMFIANNSGTQDITVPVASLVIG